VETVKQQQSVAVRNHQEKEQNLGRHVGQRRAGVTAASTAREKLLQGYDGKS